MILSEYFRQIDLKTKELVSVLKKQRITKRTQKNRKLHDRSYSLQTSTRKKSKAINITLTYDLKFTQVRLAYEFKTKSFFLHSKINRKRNKFYKLRNQRKI